MVAFPKNYTCVIQPGGPAGPHEVHSQGIYTGDSLVSVRLIHGPLLGVNIDLTAEFSVLDNNTIDNTAGTDSTGSFLAIMWCRNRG
jgi:hypothetical protein